MVHGLRRPQNSHHIGHILIATQLNVDSQIEA